MKPSAKLAGLSSFLVLAAGFVACESDDPSNSGPQFSLPDAAPSAVDSAAQDGPADDGADPDAGSEAGPDDDPTDAGDGGDGGDGSVAAFAGLIGSIGGTPTEDRCPPGQVMIGVSGGTVGAGFYLDVLSAFRVLCGTARLPAAGSTDVTVEPGAVVPPTDADPRGNVAATPAQLTCPANQVVVSVNGRTVAKNFPPLRAVVSQLELVCAPLTHSNGVSTIGAGTAAGSLGSTNGVAVGPFACGPDTTASGMRVHSGEILDGAELRCEPTAVAAAQARN
ncbi:MAG: hypothetical protein KF894_29665 [Labilithrix sp.]|nr:hypothetical protein [Labilithrix sp.]